jgi:uncharacterized alpha-E superfamily protein
MLSRTADSLFWLGRYSERAGNIARGLAASLRMASLVAPFGQEESEWRALLVASGGDPAFREKHGEATQESAVFWLTLDADNPSSIQACIEAGRRNARAVRTALTVDMWEAINDTWNELRHMDRDTIHGDRLSGFLDWVKARTLLFNGAAADTMLRDDAWRFVHLGTMLERADNTARLLDVRHLALAPDAPDEPATTAQWQAILRAVSALRAYQHVYHAGLEPKLIVDMLVHRQELPRSMRFCYSRVERTLEEIARSTGRRGTAHDVAARLHRELRETTAEQIMAEGVHSFLTGLIDCHIGLGQGIAELYLSGG